MFVDIEPETYMIAPVQVETALTRCTKAVIPVHLFGHPCDMNRPEQLVAAYSLVLIENASEALQPA